MADSWYSKDITHEDRCDQRKELLSATPEDLVAFAGPLEKLAEAAGICVLGSQRQIDACAGNLDVIAVL